MNRTVLRRLFIIFINLINDNIYYQDDNDYCRIHVCDLDGSNDRVFINEYVYAFIFNGTDFHYLTYEDKNLKSDEIINDEDNKLKRIVKCCDINGKNDKMMMINI